MRATSKTGARAWKKLAMRIIQTMRAARFYGALRMTVAIRKDGSVADAMIDQSSGSQILDRAARRIVQMAGPYPPFPPEIARDTDILEITRTWIFTNDQLATRSAKP